MNQRLLRNIAFTLSLISVININYAQNFSQSGFNVGAKAGVSKLLGEIPYGLTEIINEFDNKVGIASAIEISKYISPRWEIGSEIGYSILNGNTFSPEFSSEGIQAGIPAEINDPVEYSNKLFGQNIFFRFFFKPAGTKSAFNTFIRAGGGYLNYNSKFKYIDALDEDILFGKGADGYTKLSTPLFFIGTGIKTSLASNFYLISSIDFNMVNYDFLDVMHNYSNDGIRLEMIGLYTEIKIGIFYKFGKSNSENNNKNRSRHNSKASNSYLPFSP